MATGDFLPTRDADLINWARGFSRLLNETPDAFGVSPAQAATFASLADTYTSAYALTQSNTTRTPSRILAKNKAKESLIADARALSKQIQSAPSVTNEQKAQLGLAIPREAVRVARPKSAPQLFIMSTVGRCVTIRLCDADHPTKRGRPAGVAFATILTYVGNKAPADIGEWRFAGNTSKVTKHRVHFPASVPAGSKVWITAMWYNSRAEQGPVAMPKETHIADGLTRPLAM